MNKYMLLVLNFLCVVVATQAQQHQYSWKIGVHGGFSTYYGDLSHQFFDVHHKMTSPFQNLDFWAYGLSVEHHVNRFLGLKLMGFKSQILANDRTYTNSANYDRGLNFQTDIVDVSLLGTFYLDNGTVFGHKAVVSPYFLFGVGFTYFDTKADLFGNNGGRYYYWSDNTIRTLGEADPNANSAQVIIQDQKYETAVKNLKTEGDNYQPFTWNVSAGLGFKFRLSKRFHLHLEAMLKYTGTDYLDDVSGKYLPYYVDNFQGYAANPTNSSNVYRGTSPNMNDWYTFLALSLHYSFGQKTYDIRPSILYTPLLVVTDTIKKEFVIVKETQDSLMSNNTNGQIVKTVITTITTTNNANNVPQNIEIDSVIIEKEEANVLENYSKDSVVLVEKVIVSKMDTDTIISLSETIKDDSLKNEVVEMVGSISLPNAKDSVIQDSTNSNKNMPSQELQNMHLNAQQQRYDYELKLLKQDYESQLKIQKLQHELQLEKKQKVLPPSSADQELQKLKLEHELKLQKQDYEYQLKIKDLQHALELEKLKNNKTSFKESNKTDSVVHVSVSSTESKTIITNNNTEVEKRLDNVLKMLDSQQQKIDILMRKSNDSFHIITATNADLDITTLKKQNQNLLNKIQELEKSLMEPTTKIDTVQVVKRDSIYLNAADDKNDQLVKELNRQKEMGNDLIEKLNRANQTINQQKILVDSLSFKVNQLKTVSAAKSDELEKFLNKQVSSHITKIYFDVNKTALTMQAEETLTTLVSHLKNYPDVQLLVKGFASKKGNPERNNQLSNERATVVAAYLQQKGININRIKTASLGDSQSTDNNDVDRRAEVHLHF